MIGSSLNQKASSANHYPDVPSEHKGKPQTRSGNSLHLPRGASDFDQFSAAAELLHT
jgi:hypothetical protein